jgi:hypothetical protein
MNDFFKNLLGGLTNMLNSLSGGNKPSQAQSAVVIEPAVIVSPRVLVIVIDPIIDPVTGEKLTQHMKWSRPEDLISGFIADVLETSGGLAHYQIVQRINVNEFPVKTDGFHYTPQAYLSVLKGSTPAHQPDTLNYQDFLDRYKILQLVSANQIDEVWAFGFPYAGFYESTMGGFGAFFCNSDPLKNTSSCHRRFVLMGFSNERGVGEMLHSFGHRVESIMQQVYLRATGSANLWQRFTRYDKTSPGQAEIGTIHFPPNGQKDYDYTNTHIVPSHCDDWYNFPNFKGTVKQVNNTEWGGGDIRVFTKWWLKHLPKVGGRTNGIANNWWQYILDPNRVTV